MTNATSIERFIANTAKREAFFEVWVETTHEIKEWSLTNFGPNRSSLNSMCELDYLAPLMGMGEEIAEWYDRKSFDEERDSVADFFIFAADFGIRFCKLMLKQPGVEFDEYCSIKDIHDRAVALYIERKGKDAALNPHQEYCKLMHPILKTNQGIRGFGGNDESYLKIMTQFWNLCFVVYEVATLNNIDVHSAFTETWARVSKRDWNKDKLKGGEA